MHIQAALEAISSLVHLLSACGSSVIFRALLWIRASHVNAARNPSSIHQFDAAKNALCLELLLLVLLRV